MENTVDVPIPPNVIGTIVPPMDMPSVPQRPEGSIYYEQVFVKVVLNLATLAGTIIFTITRYCSLFVSDTSTLFLGL